MADRLSIPRSFLLLPASIRVGRKSPLLVPAFVQMAAETECQIFLAQPNVGHSSYSDKHTCSDPAG